MSERSGFQVRLSGTGGQALGLAGRLLADALVADGMQVAQSQSYEPVSRGGTSRSELVAGAGTVDYPLVTALDYLVLLDQSALEDSGALVKPGGLVLVDSDRVPAPPSDDFTVRALPLSESARAW